jgi:hypothetical protein
MGSIGSSQLACIAWPQSKAAALPKVASSSRDQIQQFIHTAAPAVITQQNGTLELGRCLNPDVLRVAFGTEKVTVSISQGGAFRYDAEKTLAKRMSFADFADYVGSVQHTSGERMYLSQFPLDDLPSAVRADLRAPAHIPDGISPVAQNIWFGPAGTISPLHFDRSHNLLVQHYGRKHVVMVAPQHSAQLMPGAKNSPSPHVSSLDLVVPGSEIDLSRLNAPHFQAVIEPGDILFIPAFWWHNVTSLTTAISTNYWWRPPIDACLHDSFFRMVSSRAVYDDPSILHRWVDVAPHQLDTGLCRYLAAEGHLFGATALAAAMVTAFCQKALRALGMAVSDRPARGSDSEFAELTAVVYALTAHRMIDGDQCELLLEWLRMAEETAAEPEPSVYPPARSVAIRQSLLRLHTEFGSALSR